jgi:hypothetical protein
MKRIAFILLMILTGNSFVDAQTDYSIQRAFDFFNSNKTKFGDWKAAESSIEGSPNLNDNFIEGSVFDTLKTVYVDVPLRYNIYNDEIEFQMGDGPVQALAVPEIIEKIEMGNYHLEYIPYIVSKKVQYGFCFLLEKGDVSLYCRQRVIFEEAKQPAAYEDARPARFTRRPDEYYIRFGGEAATLIANKCSLKALFPDHPGEMAKYLKKNGVKMNDPESLKALVRFYNGL